MEIDKQIIKNFANKGITLRPSYEKTDEELYKNLLKKSYDFLAPYYTYNDDCNGITRGMTEEQVEEARRKEAKEFADRNLKSAFSDATTLWVYMQDVQFPIKNLGKYELITEDFLNKRIERELKKYNSPYGTFAKRITRLLDKENIIAWSIYPTTYGIGIWSFFNFNADSNAKLVEKLLKQRNVTYYNEYSAKRWVYRFKISKAELNLQKLEA
jgi:hypothetical protein